MQKTTTTTQAVYQRVGNVLFRSDKARAAQNVAGACGWHRAAAFALRRLCNTLNIANAITTNTHTTPPTDDTDALAASSKRLDALAAEQGQGSGSGAAQRHA
jgi:hypothetical protein